MLCLSLPRGLATVRDSGVTLRGSCPTGCVCSLSLRAVQGRGVRAAGKKPLMVCSGVRGWEQLCGAGACRGARGPLRSGPRSPALNGRTAPPPGPGRLPGTSGARLVETAPRPRACRLPPEEEEERAPPPPAALIGGSRLRGLPLAALPGPGSRRRSRPLPVGSFSAARRRGPSAGDGARELRGGPAGRVRPGEA